MFYTKKFKKFKNINHCFFSRKNGFSKGIYSSLNCGKGSKDSRDHINKNLEFVCKKLGIENTNPSVQVAITNTIFHFAK